MPRNETPVDSASSCEARLGWLDVARVVACLCVLAIHVVYRGGRGGGVALAIYEYYAVSGASDLFFMISGALMLWRPRELCPFLRRRAARVIVPMLVWSVLVMLLNVGLGRLDWGPFWRRMALLPVEAQVPQYWFIYCLTGLYALTPALSSWLAQCRRRDVEALLALWALSLFVPLLAHSVPEADTALDVQHGWLYYFHGYAGLYLLGYYLRRYAAGWRLWPVVAATVAVASMPLWIKLFHLNTSLLCHRLSPTMAGLTACVFALLMRVRVCTRWAGLWKRLSDATFVTYLAHMPLIMFVVWPLVTPWQMNYAWGVPLLVVVVFAVCFALGELLRRLPGGRWLGAAR